MTRALLDDMVQIERTLDVALACRDEPVSAIKATLMARDRARQAIQRHTTQEETEMTNSDNEFRTLAEHNVGEGDVVQHKRDDTKWVVKMSDEGLALWQESSKFWGIALEESEEPYRVLSRAPKPEQRNGDKLHFDDLTAITCPFGMLDAATQERLKAWPHGWEFWNIEEWDMARVPSSGSINVYRAKPAPQPAPDVPWSALADWVQYVAMDENGSVWGYCSAPAKGEFQWSGSEVEDFCDVRAIKIDWKGLPWDQTLTKRPEGV
jgi:hypothetical protein